MSETPACPACGVPARSVYPFAGKWAAHPCGCVLTCDQAWDLDVPNYTGGLTVEEFLARNRGESVTAPKRIQRKREPPHGKEQGSELQQKLTRLARLEGLFNGGPDTPCRTTWRTDLDGFDPIECVEVPMKDLREAFGYEEAP